MCTGVRAPLFFWIFPIKTVRPVRAKARHAKQRARAHTRRRRKEKMSFTAAAASKTTFLAPSLSATTKRTTTRSTSRGGVGQSASKGRRCVQVRAGEDVVVSIDELTETTRKAIKTYGYDDKATECILDILMYAQLRGNNQGACRTRRHSLLINFFAVLFSLSTFCIFSSCVCVFVFVLRVTKTLRT